MINFIKIFFFSILVNISCKAQVKLSFKNESSEKFKILKVEMVNSTHYFKNLNPGESTLPIIVRGTYSYCPMQIITNRDTLRFIPIDYMGENYYSSGKLKMLLKLSDDNPKRRINITAKR